MGRGTGKQGWSPATLSRQQTACMFIIFSLILLQASFSMTANRRLSESAASLRGVAEQQQNPSSRPAANNNGEYIMWSQEDAYFAHCRKHIINNYTWGQQLSSYVDKVTAKQFVEEWNIPHIKTVKTLATLTKENYTNFTLDFAEKSLPSEYIIKPAHTSGAVARVQDGVYQCIKACHGNSSLEYVMPMVHKTMNTTLAQDYSLEHGEMQYKNVPRRYIIEELLDMTKFDKDVTFWYMSNGKPIYVSMTCREPVTNEVRRNLYSANFEKLPIQMKHKSCTGETEKPPQWDNMLEIVNAMSPHLPNVPVRIDLYASDEEVYFSEFTYTTKYCYVKLQPLVAEGLLYAVHQGQVDPKIVTADYVTKTVTDQSWILVHRRGRTLLPQNVSAYPSPLDLCVNNFFHKEYNDCIGTAKKVASYDLRCIVSDGKHQEAIGLYKNPTILQSMSERVNWLIAVPLLIIVLVMSYCKIGFDTKKNQYFNIAIYCLVISVYLRIATHNHGFFSGSGFWVVAKDAFEAFKIVHPMTSSTSPVLVFTHLATYWFSFACWRSKSLYYMLFWQLMLVTVSTSVTEFAHDLYLEPEVRCMRLAFISNMKFYVIDEMVRSYILPPFFVYGYMLPTFIFHWIGVFVGLGSAI